MRIWIRALGQGPRGAGARAGQTRIGLAGGSNPDPEIGRVKSKTGDAPRQNKKRGEKKRARAVAAVLAEIDLNPAPI